MRMRYFLTVLLCVMIPTMALADSGYKVAYDGGSLQGIKAGNKAHLYIDADQVRIVKGKTVLGRVNTTAMQLV